MPSSYSFPDSSGQINSILLNLQSLAELNPHDEFSKDLNSVIKEAIQNPQHPKAPDSQEMTRANIYKRYHYDLPYNNLGLIKVVALTIISILSTVFLGNGATEVLDSLTAQYNKVKEDEAIWNFYSKAYKQSYDVLMQQAIREAKILTMARFSIHRPMNLIERISLIASPILMVTSLVATSPVIKIVGLATSALTIFFFCKLYGKASFDEWFYAKSLKQTINSLNIQLPNAAVEFNNSYSAKRV